MDSPRAQPQSFPSRPKRFFKVATISSSSASVDDSNDIFSPTSASAKDSSFALTRSSSVDSTDSSSLCSPTSSSFEEGDLKGDSLSFRYRWPLKLCRRRMGPTPSDSSVLHVSPAFCTASNGVQFTWLLRMFDFQDLSELDGGEEEVREAPSDDTFGREGSISSSSSTSPRKRVNVTLYYKDGPARDVTLQDVRISILNNNGERLFCDIPLEGLEYTKGSGWSAPLLDPIGGGGTSDQWTRLSHFIHDNINRHITVIVQLRISTHWFYPLQYLPPLGTGQEGSHSSPSTPFYDNGSQQGWRLAQLHQHCSRVLDDIVDGQLKVPDLDLFPDQPQEKFNAQRHRQIFNFACAEVLRRGRCLRKTSVPEEREVAVDPIIATQVENIFAHLYFDRCVTSEGVKSFEDFVAVLDALVEVHFPAMKMEVERHICGDVIAESADLPFVKKALLLAERYQLPVLKMVSCGVIVDKMLASSTTQQPKRAPAAVEENMDEMREELLQIAESITAIEEGQHHRQHQQHINERKRGVVVIDAAVEDEEDADEGLDSDNFTPSQSSSPTLELIDPHTTPTATASVNIHPRHHGEKEELLVGSVIDQLEELALHIRKVSMQPGISPAPAQQELVAAVEALRGCGSSLPQSLIEECSKNRRSSLRITRH